MLLLGLAIPVNVIAPALAENHVAPSPSSITPQQSQPPPHFSNWAAWHGYIAATPTPAAGCFEATYPNPVWQKIQCGAPARGHEMRSHTATTPQTASCSGPPCSGSGTEWVAQSCVLVGGCSTYIGSAIGSFPSVTTTGETDVCVGPAPYCTTGGQGANSYGLQENTEGGNTAEGFPVNSPYSNNAMVTGWEQFIYQSSPNTTPTSCTAALNSCVWIEYWLLNYNGANCPSTPGGCCSLIPAPPSGVWATDTPAPATGGDCVNNPSVVPAPYTPPTSLSSLTLGAFANLGGNDEAQLCVSGGSCYTFSNPANELNLYKQWRLAEFDVFGYINGSRAVFNPLTTITVLNTIKDQSGNVIAPISPCPNNGQTGETNNLNLGSCAVNSGPGQIFFAEGNLPQNSMTVSYSTPGGTGLSTAPIFSYVEMGAPTTYTLTNTPTVVSVDSGTSWSVTPNPLAGSASNERWLSTQTLSGASATETLNFVFYHQYLETLSYSILPALNKGSPGNPTWTALQFGVSTPQPLAQFAISYWYDASSSWTVTPNPLAGSTSLERWYTSQSTSGTVSSPQTVNFVYDHQFSLTTGVSPSSAYGTTSPAPGSYWETYESAQSVSEIPNAGYAFAHWTISGATCAGGSTVNPCGFTVPNNPVSVTAVFAYTVTFKQVGIPAGVTWGVTVGVTHYTSTSSSVTVSGLSGSVPYTYDASVPVPAPGSGSYTCVSGCSGSVTGPTTLTATYAVQLVVVLQYPANGGTVSTGTVVLIGLVEGFPVEPGVGGATVNVYLNGVKVCTVTSSYSGVGGEFFCIITNLTPGTYSWYATAAKTGYAPGTSPTWTFTKTGS